MDNTSAQEASPTKNPLSAIFVSFRFKGNSNGVPQEGFDSRVINAPEDVWITSAEDLKAVADALAESEFQAGKKFTGFEITIINIVRLPV